MKTVKQVSKLTGVSIRTLHYYDSIGLLPPTEITDAGYRMYGDAALARLQVILLFRELEFPLKTIKKIVDSRNFDVNTALQQQFEMLQLKKEHIENLITLTREIQLKGVNNMDFSAFDTKKIDDYAKQAKEKWGKTDEYRQYEKKSEGRSKENEEGIASGLMDIFKELGTLRGHSAGSDEVQKLVEKLRQYITDNYYDCKPQIFRSLGMMYDAGGSMTDNIDSAGGKGTAELAHAAIEIYCDNK